MTSLATSYEVCRSAVNISSACRSSCVPVDSVGLSCRENNMYSQVVRLRAMLSVQAAIGPSRYSKTISVKGRRLLEQLLRLCGRRAQLNLPISML